MFVRFAVASLWFFATWFTFGLGAYFLGVSAGFGAVLGAMAAAWVLADPAGIVWKARGAADPQVSAVNQLEAHRAAG